MTAYDNFGNLLSLTQGASTPTSATLHSAATSTGAGTALPTTGMATVVFTVSGTFSATVTFTGTQDGTTYTNLIATQEGTILQGTTATGPGVFRASCDGYQNVIANITQYTSGSVTVTATAQPNAGSSHIVTSNTGLWNGLVPGNSNPVITEDQIRGYIVSGQGFSATIAITTAAANVAPGWSLYNPSSSGKALLIYSIKVGATGSNASGTLNLYTADGSFGPTVTPVNLRGGGGASVATCDSTPALPTASATVYGTTFENYAVAQNGVYDLLTSGRVLFLPAGAANSLLVYLSVVTSGGKMLGTISWLEI
jgi:hypothetical protein